MRVLSHFLSRPGPKPRRKAEGFSLVEVMIGLLVFSVLALGLTATALHNLRSAQQNIMRNTAFSVAQGFLEQLKSIPETALLDALADPDGVPLPTRSISATSANSVEQIDSPLYLDDPGASGGRENYREVLIDLREDPDGDISEVFLDMWLDVDITPLTTSRGYLLEIEFTYVHPALGQRGAQTDSVRMVRTRGAEN